MNGYAEDMIAEQRQGYTERKNAMADLCCEWPREGAACKCM